MDDVTANLRAVKDRISAAAHGAGHRAEDVRLVLVTKTVAPQRIRLAIAAGQRDLGENKVQEGRQQAQALADEALTDGPLRWSMIGHLQTNKVKDVLGFASEVQSLDRLSLAAALDRRLQRLGRGLDVLVQVNTSGEASKFGLTPQELPAFLRELPAFSALRPRGLMTLATFTPDEGEVRRCFRLLRALRDRARQEAPQAGQWAELSMGMSGDYVWAIEEGASLVRVGQAVFGKRAVPDAHYWPGVAGTAP